MDLRLECSGVGAAEICRVKGGTRRKVFPCLEGEKSPGDEAFWLLCWKKPVWFGLSEQESGQVAGGGAGDPVPPGLWTAPQSGKRNVHFVWFS